MAESCVQNAKSLDKMSEPYEVITEAIS